MCALPSRGRREDSAVRAAQSGATSFNEAFNFFVPCPDEEDLVATVCHRDASVFGGGDQDVCRFTLRLVDLIDAEGGKLDADFDMHDGSGSGRIHLQLTWYSFKFSR